MRAYALTQSVGSVDNAVNATFEFWNWLNQNRDNKQIDPRQVLRVATETASLHLPETMKSKRTLGTIVQGTVYISTPGEDTRRVQALNGVILELSASPDTPIDDLPTHIFKDEQLVAAQKAIFELGKLIVTTNGENWHS